MKRARRCSASDSAASDMVSTLLLVAMVVLIGGVVATGVTATLSGPTPSPVAFGLKSPTEGDLTLTLRHQNGATLELDALRLTLQRNGSSPETITRGTWSTPNASRLAAGHTLTFPLSMPVVAGETLRVHVYDTVGNQAIADVSARIGAGSATLADPTLVASATPPSVPADGASPARLTVSVSHPAGGLAIARVTGDASTIGLASGTALTTFELRDDGREGDVTGGDGIWSALLRVPTQTPPAAYAITFQAVDANGRTSTAINTTLVTTEATAASAPPTTGEGGAEASGPGAQFSGPTSENVTRFLLRNWTWDKLHPERLDGDFLTVRIAGGGKSWSARVALQENAGEAYATELLVWHDTKETRYTPDVGSIILGGGIKGTPLGSLEINMTNPLEGNVWQVSQYAPHPEALYQNAGISVAPRFVVPYFGHDVTTGNAESSISTGIISVEVVFV